MDSTFMDTDGILSMEIEEAGNSNSIDKKSRNDGNRKTFEASIKCSVCSIDFYTDKHYKRHLGTKKHKRNYGKLQHKDMVVTGLSRNVQLDSFERQSSYKGVREEYWQRNMKNYENNYTSYIWSVTAYWTASLVANPTVKDFKISLNDKKWGDFGDAVIEIEFVPIPGKSNNTNTFAIQFKHIVSNNFRNIESLSQGSFSFKNAISKLVKIKEEQDWKDVRFIVFTTAVFSPALNAYNNSINIAFCSACYKLEKKCVCDLDGKDKRNGGTTEVPVYVRPSSQRRKNVIDTSDDTQSIYYFFSSNNKFVLPRIYFHTSQKKPRYFPASIDEIFFETLNERSLQVSRELIKHIENWSEGRCGGFYKLKKEDVLIKLGQLLLSKFVLTPKVQPINPQSKFKVWMKAVDSVHVTVLRNSINLSELCGTFNSVIEQELGAPIYLAKESLRFLDTNEQSDVFKKIRSPILRDYFLEEFPRSVDGKYGDLQIEKIYLTFWKAGLIPMILHVDNLKNQEFLLQVINFLHDSGLHRKYLLKTTDTDINSFVKNFKNLSFFVSLDDVIEKLDPALLDQVKINVTDTFSLPLRVIRETDEFFQRDVSANEFFDMTLGKCTFKPSGGHVGEAGTVELKLTLNDNQMTTLKHEVKSKIDYNIYLLKSVDVSQKRHLRGLDPKLFF